MTADIFPEDAYRAFEPEYVVPAAMFLVSPEAPTDAIVAAGGGVFQGAWITMNEGVLLPETARSAEDLAAAWPRIADRTGDRVFENGMEQAHHALQMLTRGRN
jgi:hypothetical protein